MKTFEEWIKEEHPEALEEGWMKNLAVGGALLGAGMGVGGMMRGPAQQGNPQQAVTQQAQQKPMNAWQAKKAEMARQKAELQRKTQGMKNGQTRTIIQGQVQDDKNIEGGSWTSPAASEFFK